MGLASATLATPLSMAADATLSGVGLALSSNRDPNDKAGGRSWELWQRSRRPPSGETEIRKAEKVESGLGKMKLNTSDRI